MKSIILTILISITLVGNVLAGYYPGSSTYYGRNPNTDDEESEKNPFCGIDIPGDRHFAALKRSYEKDYCGYYVVALTTDPDAKTSFSEATMVKALIIDACGGCAADQVDLSYDSWKTIAKDSDEGVHKIYWIVLDSKGNTKLGPWGSSLSSLASRFGVSQSLIKEAFVERAKKMVLSNDNTYEDWPWKGYASQLQAAKKTTTKKTTTSKKSSSSSSKKTTTSTTKKTSTKKTSTKVSNSSPTVNKNDESDEYLKNEEIAYSKSYKCGKGYGKCREGYCCSRYGWCGKTSAYCSVKKGCQSSFGDCKDYKRSPYRCGKTYGKCRSGCCSKYGWCGTSESYCGEGCQSEFGSECYEDRGEDSD